MSKVVKIYLFPEWVVQVDDLTFLTLNICGDICKMYHIINFFYSSQLERFIKNGRQKHLFPLTSSMHFVMFCFDEFDICQSIITIYRLLPLKLVQS